MKRLLVLAALAAATSVAVTASPALAAATAPTRTARTAKVTFVPSRFEVQAGRLVATGSVSFDNPATTASGGATNMVTVPVLGATAVGTTGTCQVLHVVVGPVAVGPTHVERVVFDLTGTMPGNLLCSLAGVVSGTSPSAFVEAVLNRLLARVDNAVASGSGPNGALFAGSFNPRQAVVGVSSSPAVTGELHGRLTQPGRTPQTVDQTATLQIAIAGSCGSMHLETASATVEMHGVQIQLRPITLGPTPVMGGANGDLLCSISMMLNGRSLQGIAFLLNTMLK